MKINFPEPEFLKPLKSEYTFLVGQTAKIDVQADNIESDAIVTWSHKGHEVDPLDKKYTMARHEGICRLTIKDTVKEDEGPVKVDITSGKKPVKITSKTMVILQVPKSLTLDELNSNKPPQLTMQKPVKPKPEVIKTVFISQNPTEKLELNEGTKNVVLEGILNQPSKVVKWTRDEKSSLSHYDSDFQMISDGVKQQLIIKEIKPNSTGEFYCKVEDAEISFQVVSIPKIKTPPPEPIPMPEMDQVQKFSTPLAPVVDAVIGKDLILECKVNDTNTKAKWFRDSIAINLDKRISAIRSGMTRKLKIQNVNENDAGFYSCETMDDVTKCQVNVRLPELKISKKIFFDSAEPFVVQQGSNFCPQFELNRSINEEDDVEVEWRLDETKLVQGNGVNMSGYKKIKSLELKNVGLEMNGKVLKGLIVQKSKNMKPIIALERVIEVKLPPVKFISGLNNLSTFEGKQILLSCAVSHPEGKTTWYKDDQELSQNERIKFIIDHKNRKLLVNQCEQRDSGEYSCKTDNDSTKCKVTVTKEPLTIMEDLENVCIQTGESCQFKIVLSREVSDLIWYHDEMVVYDAFKDFRFEIKDSMEQDRYQESQLIITNLRPKESGVISVKVEGELISQAVLEVLSKYNKGYIS